LIDDNGNTIKQIDIKSFRDLITERPKAIVSQNGKMKKSGGKDQIFFNTTLPALNGIAVNEATGEFFHVVTCGNAGPCKLICYAKKGDFTRFAPSSLRQTRILNYLLNDFDGYKQTLKAELHLAKTRNSKTQTVLRWNDAGDMLSEVYFEMVVDIANTMPDVLFYFYTKEVDMVRKFNMPSNLVANYSKGGHQDANIGPNDKSSDVIPTVLPKTKVKLGQFIKRKFYFKNQKSIDNVKKLYSEKLGTPVNKILTSNEANGKQLDSSYTILVLPDDTNINVGSARIIPIKEVDVELWKLVYAKKKYIEAKWVYRGPNEIKSFKNALANEYNISPTTLLTDEELENTPLGSRNQYNSIVLPGETDISATRSDVHITYLYFH
jgi:hypothetical protein